MGVRAPPGERDWGLGGVVAVSVQAQKESPLPEGKGFDRACEVFAKDCVSTTTTACYDVGGFLQGFLGTFRVARYFHFGSGKLWGDERRKNGGSFAAGAFVFLPLRRGQNQGSGLRTLAHSFKM